MADSEGNGKAQKLKDYREKKAKGNGSKASKRKPGLKK